MNRIVIIGASSGLGQKIALDFAASGWTVGVAARRIDRLEQLRERYPESIHTEAMDVSTPEAVDHLHDLIDKCGGMDVLLYASGTGWHNPELDAEKELRTVGVNVDGFTRIVTAAFKYFAQNGGGQIAALTSVAGTKGLGVAPAYSASKRYQWNYLQAIDQLAHAHGLNIRITDIRPGFMNTALLAEDPDRSRLPMVMDVDYAARRIERAILRQKHTATIDWRWRALCGLWRRVPNFLWRHLRAMM
ncbi:MAG: SDR family NAD(P)-dependent oxidoreductase [Muribaculaceae bacterium]|nr:SDR family NAD(P)-dependent oxidoreductase [Muribaculaceae bacterium]